MSNAFGEALKSARISENMSQADVADLIGTGQPTISQWEIGNLCPVTENLYKLYDVFPSLRDVTAPPSRDSEKPVGNPLGNPGKRSASARKNMAAARAGKKFLRFRRANSVARKVIDERKETVEALILRLVSERDEALAEAAKLRTTLTDAAHGIAALAEQVKGVAA